MTLAGATAPGDRILLERVVTNLVQNAIRHNEPGGTACIRASADTLVVENSGRTIPSDIAPMLFEPFHRLDERIDSAQGVGLALSIVRSVAQAHGGDATASAQPTGGLRITATFGAQT